MKQRRPGMVHHARAAIRTICLLLAASGALLLGSATASAQQERILNFDSRIEVQTSGDVLITESITVFAVGKQIKRGIYRDFPTVYKDRLNNTVRVGFTVLDVRKNGKPEPYRVENQTNGKRVYIGDKNVFLQTGEYTYTIKYRTNRQIGFFGQYDEIYWNATGNGWNFVIERATATVVLPKGANVQQSIAYTGQQGQQGTDYVQGEDIDGNTTFTTTQPLLPRNGLTVAVAFQKGIVREPTASEKAGYLLSDNLSLIFGMIALVVLTVYYLGAWVAVGRDPEKGTIIPRFTPPDGFSPAMCRVLMRMGFDQKSYAAAIVSLAVKGYLRIEETAKNDYTLRRTGADPKDLGLSAGERRLAAKLFRSNNTLKLKQSNHATIGGAQKALKTSLKTDLEITHFKKNTKHFLIGLGLTLLVIVAVVLGANDLVGAGFMSLWLTGWSFGVIMLVRQVLTSFQTGRNFMAVFMALFALPFVAGEIGGIVAFSQFAGAYGVVILLAAAAINATFYILLKAPTFEGRRIMDEIEGFKMYLETAEKDRLEAMHPPERTPQLFEKFLPYAMALEVENKWASQFEDVLKTSGEAGKSYSPSWYSGSSWSSASAPGFASSLSSTFAGVVSSSSTAPGSSSGSGGGGSSGGGGGGGGGGGW